MTETENDPKMNDSTLLMLMLLAYATALNGGEFPQIKQQKNVYKRECASYREEHDMGATIPYCEYAGLYEDFDCEDCPKFRLSERAKKLMEMHDRLEAGDEKDSL